METNAIINRKAFLFKSLFGQTLDEMDFYEYEDFFIALMPLEGSKLGAFYDKTGTYFIMPINDAIIDYDIFRVTGSGYEDNNLSGMSYEHMGETDIEEIDEIFDKEGIYLKEHTKENSDLFLEKISSLKEKYNFNGLYYFTDFSNLFQILKLGYIFSENEKRINNFIAKEIDYKTNIHNAEHQRREKIKFEFSPNKFKKYKVEGINNIKFINSNLYLPIPVYLIFDEDLILWDTSEFCCINAENMDFITGDSFEFFNSIDWDRVFYTNNEVNVEMLSKIPIPLSYCKNIVFKSQADKKLAVNLFGENEKFSVDLTLFTGMNMENDEVKNKNSYGFYRDTPGENILTLNKDELGLILYGFEVYFSNIYLLNNNKNIGNINIFEKTHPTIRYSKIKEIYANQEKLENIIEKRFADIKLIDKYKSMLATDLVNNFKEIYFTAFESYKKYYAYYLINNSWRLLRKSSSYERELFLETFNGFVRDTFENNQNAIQVDLWNNPILCTRDVDNAIDIIKYYIILRFIGDFKKQSINIFSESLALEVLFKLLEFKNSYFNSNIINIGDIVLLKNMNNFRYERYMIIEKVNEAVISLEENSKDINDDSNIIKATINSRIGKVLINSKVQDIVEIEDGKVFKIVDIVKKYKNDKIIVLDIVESYITDNWTENTFYNLGIGNEKFGFRDETPLKQTGYSIWDGNKKRTREERLQILINKSIPILGLDEVVNTIQNHIYYKWGKEYAVQEWEYDLAELKKRFYRTDKVNYFD